MKYETEGFINISIMYDDFEENQREKYKKELDRLLDLIPEEYLQNFENIERYFDNQKYYTLNGYTTVYCRCRKNLELYNIGENQYYERLKEVKKYYSTIKSELFSFNVYEPYDRGFQELFDF